MPALITTGTYKPFSCFLLLRIVKTSIMLIMTWLAHPQPGACLGWAIISRRPWQPANGMVHFDGRPSYKSTFHRQCIEYHRYAPLLRFLEQFKANTGKNGLVRNFVLNDLCRAAKGTVPFLLTQKSGQSPKNGKLNLIRRSGKNLISKGNLPAWLIRDATPVCIRICLNTSLN